MSRGRNLLVAGAFALAAPIGDAHAWDAATTHAGLTERAAQASPSVKRLGQWFGLPLGAYEVLRLEARDERARTIHDRLSRLDPASGLAPQNGRLPAIGWLIAGSVLEETPPERRRNHFFDPTSGRGLSEGGPFSGFGYGVRSIGTGEGSFGDLVLGEAFDGTGMSSIEWMTSPDNDLSVKRFLDARERAVVAAQPADRQSALADALLTAGALLHIVEDSSVPAYVHNDYKTDLFAAHGPLLAYASERYGRLDVPAPSGEAVPVAHLADLVHRPDGSGLADRTARSFFSLGQLTGDEQVSTPTGLPPLTPGPGPTGYILADGKVHLAHYTRVRPGAPDSFIRWDLDARCLADYTATLLPAAGRAALSALEHLFRDPLVVEGGVVKNGSLALGPGRLVILLDDERGVRKAALKKELHNGIPAGATLFEVPESFAGKHAVVVFRGVDEHGEPIVTHAELGE